MARRNLAVDEVTRRRSGRVRAAENNAQNATKRSDAGAHVAVNEEFRVTGDEPRSNKELENNSVVPETPLASDKNVFESNPAGPPKPADSQPQAEVDQLNPDGVAGKIPEKPNIEQTDKPGPASDDNVLEIERLASHRVNKDTSTVDFFVEWVDTAGGWQPEHELQLQVPDLIFEYWEALGGREKATDLEEFHVFRILESTVDPPQYRVQWVGYRDTPADTSWETEAYLRHIAPKALELYKSSHKKRSAKGKPGRPRKKLKTSRNSTQ